MSGAIEGRERTSELETGLGNAVGTNRSRSKHGTLDKQSGVDLIFECFVFNVLWLIFEALSNINNFGLEQKLYFISL